MSAATIESAAADADALGVLNRAPAGRSRTRAWQVGRRKDASVGFRTLLRSISAMQATHARGEISNV
jgi:hypothetical protein